MFTDLTVYFTISESSNLLEEVHGLSPGTSAALTCATQVSLRAVTWKSKISVVTLAGLMDMPQIKYVVIQEELERG